MKKIMAIWVTVSLISAVAAPAAFADRRGHRHHFHSHYHHSHSADHFWVGLGVGVLTGAIVSSFYYSPPPPPPGRVVYVEPETVVVQPPPKVYATPQRNFGTPLPAAYGQVKVTPSALNLRSGPGVEHDVTGRANKDDVLDVIESVPGWFYVRTPHGTYGWVMDQYTVPTQPVG